MSDFSDKILANLPYTNGFLFVDRIIEVSENNILGEYRYKTDEFFYEGHFKDEPITPGAIILETMGQIGLVCFALYLNDFIINEKPLLTYTEMELFKTVKPGERVIVRGEKVYFRNNTLKCKILMQSADNIQIATLNAILKLS